MDGIVSRRSRCWYIHVLTSLGDSEVFGEVVRNIAMMGCDCLARYVRDSEVFYIISVFRITTSLLMSGSASLQPCVADSVIVLFTSAYTGNEQTRSKRIADTASPSDDLHTGACSDYLTLSIVSGLYNREALLVLLHMRHCRCAAEVKAASSRSTDAFLFTCFH
jgi:hypothetical protein